MLFRSDAAEVAVTWPVLVLEQRVAQQPEQREVTCLPFSEILVRAVTEGDWVRKSGNRMDAKRSRYACSAHHTQIDHSDRP